MAIDYKRAGVPLNGYVYDAVAEKFYCEGVDHLDLGIIPVSFYITVGNNWKYPIPVPESVITDFLDKTQKKQLKDFKAKNKDCFFDYFQLMGCD